MSEQHPVREKLTVVLSVDKDGVERVLNSNHPDGPASMIAFCDQSVKQMLSHLGVLIRNAATPGRCRVVEFTRSRLVDDIRFEAAPEPPTAEAEKEPGGCLICGRVLLAGQLEPRPSPVEGVPPFAVWACAECGLATKIGDAEPALIDLGHIAALPAVVVFVAGAVGHELKEALDRREQDRRVEAFLAATEKTLREVLEKRKAEAAKAP